MFASSVRRARKMEAVRPIATRTVPATRSVPRPSSSPLRPAIQDQTPAASPGPQPSLPPVPSKTVPTVDRIELVNTPRGALTGFAEISSPGSLNQPGPYTDPVSIAVVHGLQVHFHLGQGNSAEVVPRRTVQRTSTYTGEAPDKKPPDKPAAEGKPALAGGFEGSVAGPDGPPEHEIQRPSADRIVVADVPGPRNLIPANFPVTYKAHFSLTLASGGTDVAQIDYDVRIDKRTATESPDKENRSFATAKTDLVRGRSLP